MLRFVPLLCPVQGPEVQGPGVQGLGFREWGDEEDGSLYSLISLASAAWHAQILSACEIFPWQVTLVRLKCCFQAPIRSTFQSILRSRLEGVRGATGTTRIFRSSCRGASPLPPSLALEFPFKFVPIDYGPSLQRLILPF